MALLQVVEREILAETGSLAKLENNNETCSNSISDESKAGKADGTSVKSASSTDQDDENRERERTQMSNDPQLKEKQYIFLKKHFDQLRTRKRIPNFHKRYGHRYHEPIKPKKFEDLPCLCHLEKKCLIYENTNQAIELLAGQEPTTAQSDVSTKSQTNPLAGHNILCNIQRLNRYFRLFAGYFIGKDVHINLFLLDPNPPVDYKQKAMQEIRKITVLKLRDGLEDTIEEWEDCMTDKDVEKWKKRNNIREYLHFILNNMLESLIGPNESLTGSEEGPDDSDLSPSRNTRIDPDKLEYQRLKKLHDELEVKLKNARERRRKSIQKAVIGDYYNDLQKEKRERREQIYNYCNFPPAVSSEESEGETGQEKNQIIGAEK